MRHPMPSSPPVLSAALRDVYVVPCMCNVVSQGHPAQHNRFHALLKIAEKTNQCNNWCACLWCGAGSRFASHPSSSPCPQSVSIPTSCRTSPTECASSTPAIVVNRIPAACYQIAHRALPFSSGAPRVVVSGNRSGAQCCFVVAS